MRRILLLDDEVNVLNALQRTLRQYFRPEDVQVETFSDPEKALLRSGEVDFDVAISDYRMPAINGVDFLRTLKGLQPDTVRLVLSASTEFGPVLEAINQAEVFRYIPKPWHAEELKRTIELAFARHDQAAEDRRLANEMRSMSSNLTPEEEALRRLEAEEPGITKVNWAADGSVQLD